MKRKIKLKYVCFAMWIICMLSIIHIKYIQEEQTAKEETPIEKTCNTDTNYFRADDSKKNIINILILIINKTVDTYGRFKRTKREPAEVFEHRNSTEC